MVIQVKIFMENGISTVQEFLSSSTQLGEGRIKDTKFLDDNVLLVLWELDGNEMPK